MNLKYDDLTFHFDNKKKILIKNNVTQVGFMQYEVDNESCVHIAYVIEDAKIIEICLNLFAMYIFQKGYEAIQIPQHDDELEILGCIKKENNFVLEKAHFNNTILINHLQILLDETYYQVDKILGKGKGGISYLVHDEKNNSYVLKQIHHEPCSYYSFGNKIEAEYNDYQKLHSIGIPLPKLYAIDKQNERILKEYICGDTIETIVKHKEMKETYYEQIQQICETLYKNNLNIDYFPTNFVVQNEKLYYIDYECNQYMEEWNYENWGKQYWY